MLALLIGLSLEANQTAAQHTGLFVDAPFDPPAELQSTDPAIIRTRYVRPDFNQLTDTGSARRGEILTLNLFEDASFTGVIDQIANNRSGSITWIGGLENIPLGSFALVTKDGIMVGTIKMPGAFYRIMPAGDGIHAIYELDESAFPPELEPVEAEPARIEAAQNAPNADDGLIIDVLVVYTEAARENIGDFAYKYPDGFTTIQNMIDLSVAETNTSYANSDISQRINLVHTEEVVYDESGFNWSTTLNRVTGTSDGYMDNVHTIRDDYCADEVVLLVDNQNYCGIANINASASSAFAVVSTYCSAGFYSFAHEMGHNMGARHDWYVDDADTYAHGYVYSTDRWRTIMSYNADCWDRGFTCDRLNYWANPDKLYNGDPMGIPDGTSRDCNTGDHSPGCDADTRKKLNATAATVANFRDSGACTPPSTYTISGYVRNGAGTGISGVTVDFEGYRPAVTTDATGYYSQTGFVDAPYDVHFSKTDHTFSPTEDRVTISGANASLDSVGQEPVGPLEYAGHSIDDNNSGNSSGDGDGIAECGEIAEIFVDLTNLGTATATDITATLSTTDSLATIKFNTISNYPNIEASGTDDNNNDFDIVIDPLTPDGHLLPFTLEINASNGGPWTARFDLEIGCEVVYLPLVTK